MIHFRIAELIAARERLVERRIALAEIAEATGISVQTLSNLKSPRPVVTNTAYVETLCKYFRCGVADLVEFDPPVEDDERCHVDQLYPGRRGGGNPSGQGPEGSLNRSPPPE